MIPWPKHQEVLMFLIELFERLVSCERAVIIFLIPPAADYQRCDSRGLQIVGGASRFPVIIAFNSKALTPALLSK